MKNHQTGSLDLDSYGATEIQTATVTLLLDGIEGDLQDICFSKGGTLSFYLKRVEMGLSTLPVVSDFHYPFNPDHFPIRVPGENRAGICLDSLDSADQVGNGRTK